MSGLISPLLRKVTIRRYFLALSKLARIVSAGAEMRRCSSPFLSMYSPFLFSTPSFPPVDGLLSFLSRIDWRRLADRCLTAALFVAAVVHVLAVRLWANRGRLAPILRRLARFLETVASALPEPLSSDSPRPALIAALISAGDDAASIAKANRAVLVKRASRLGLL